MHADEVALDEVLVGQRSEHGPKKGLDQHIDGDVPTPVPAKHTESSARHRQAATRTCSDNGPGCLHDLVERLQVLRARRDARDVHKTDVPGEPGLGKVAVRAVQVLHERGKVLFLEIVNDGSAFQIVFLVCLWLFLPIFSLILPILA